MGFRDPITSAAAVDTRPGATVPGVRVYESGDGNARWGVVEFDDPAADAPGSLVGRVNAGAGGSVQGSLLALKPPATNGVTAPELDLNIEAAPTFGYWRVARLAADLWMPTGLPFGKVTGAGATSPTLPSGQFVAIPLPTAAKLSGGVTAAGNGLIAPASGWYALAGLVEFGGFAGGRRMAGYTINGTNQLNESLSCVFTTTNEACRVPAPAEPVALQGGDRVNLTAYQSSGASIGVNQPTCWLSMTYLGPL